MTQIEDAWIERPWMDVRRGDIVRPVGNQAAAARVIAAGPVMTWGVNDVQPLTPYERRDIQYNPGKYAGTYTSRWIELQPLAGGEPMRRQMFAALPVEIQLSVAEVRAIELLGGWGERLDADNLSS